ncbi:MAG: hypothetical protein R6U25_11505 [Alkalispirochaeta sp.]
MRAATLAQFVALILAVMLLSACSDRDSDTFELPETPALVGQGSYALVTEGYVRVHRSPDIMDAVIGHGRSGDVLEVSGTTADGQWTELDTPAGSGWVQSIYLRRFSNRQQAINARRLIQE